MDLVVRAHGADSVSSAPTIHRVFELKLQTVKK